MKVHIQCLVKSIKVVFCLLTIFSMFYVPYKCLINLNEESNRIRQELKEAIEITEKQVRESEELIERMEKIRNQ